MSASFAWSQVHFPSELEPERLGALLRAIHGLSTPGSQRPFVFETVASPQAICHRLAVPQGLLGPVRTFARTNIPGLHLEELETPPELPAVRAARRLWLSTSRRPLEQAAPEQISSALLAAWSTPRRGETIVSQLLLGPVRRGLVVGNDHAPMLSESWPIALATAPVLQPRQLDSEARRALREKQGQPGWRAVCRVAVLASSKQRAHALLRDALGAYRTLERPGVRVGYRRTPGRAVRGRELPLFWGLALSLPEAVGMLGWPFTELHGVPVLRRRSKFLPVPRSVPRRGRVLAIDPTSGRKIAQRTSDLTTHSWAVGPTGVGKSTLLLNLIAQDMAAGRSVIVIEPKQDLIRDVLARVPATRRDDLVVLDHGAKPVGFNPLLTDTPELTADQILTVFARLNTDSWGPRLSELLHAGLLTLAKTPGMSLAALPLLLTHDAFRRRVVGQLDDPLGLSPIWAAFDRMSDEARAQATASVLNKVRPMVGRRQMRGVLGQAAPRFAMADAFTSRKIVLVDLAKGVIGPDSARLMGTLFLNSLWQACLRRTQIPAERRHVVTVYIDELQDYTAIPLDLGEMLAQARGLGVAFTLANQNLRQLPPDLQAGILSNARTRVVFQTDNADGIALAKGQRLLSAEDFTNLPAREVYLRLANDAEVTPYMSGRTLPPPPKVSDPDVLRASSHDRYGVDREETDRALRSLAEGQGGAAVGTRRRRV